MTGTQHDSAYSWARLGISLALSMVGSIGLWATIVVLPDMQADFGVSRGEIALPYIVTMTGFALGNLLLGPAVDRWGMAPLLAVSALALAFGFAASTLSTHLVVVSALHAFMGLGAAACFGPLIADVSLWFLKRRGIAVAVVASGNYLSGTLWPPIIAYVMADHGWRGAYLMLAIVTITVLLPGAALLRRRIDAASTARARHLAAANAAETGLSPMVLQSLLMLAGVSCCVAMAMPQVHIVALCVDRGYGAAAGAGMLSLMLAGGVVSRVFFGGFADRFGGLVTLFLSGSLQMMALSLFLLEGSMTSLYVIALVFGLSQGGIVPSYAIVVREYMTPDEAGRRVGIVIGATVMGMALGGWMAGWLYDLTASYAAAIWNGLGWNAMNIAIALFLLSRAGPRRAMA
ncbi:MAG: MFS transporter [Silicimonas sp.]|nr:MFS transporter [Silicimonas sp.]